MTKACPAAKKVELCKRKKKKKNGTFMFLSLPWYSHTIVVVDIFLFFATEMY